MSIRLTCFRGMLKKAASGVLASLPCSRTVSTLRAPNWLRPCPWKRASWRPWVWAGDKAIFFDHSPRLLISISSRACHVWAYLTGPVGGKDVMGKKEGGDVSEEKWRMKRVTSLPLGAQYHCTVTDLSFVSL